MSFYSTMTRPRLPHAALLLDSDEVAAVELRRKGATFALAAAARTALAPGQLTPSFEGVNIPDPDQIAALLDQTAEAAGLGKREKWSALLPEAAVRSVVVTIDSTPASRTELRQMLNWKVERLVGVPAAELRMSKQFIEGGRTPRFLVVAARADVMEEYESLFAALDWRVGLLVPRFVGETAWLDWEPSRGDNLVIGARADTCQAAIVRDGELMLVRAIDGDPSRLEDEVYRLALYYRDRVAEVPESAAVANVTTYGEIDANRVASAVEEALGTLPAVIHPVPGLLEAAAGTEIGPGLLAAAGLATQAWAR